jgi:hypothetical protein
MPLIKFIHLGSAMYLPTSNFNYAIIAISICFILILISCIVFHKVWNVTDVESFSKTSTAYNFLWRISMCV